ncbi:MAG: transporter substrate-binding domain-containing protein [Eubacteriales bacterium]|nr:transporter substrate-binding domain-containing protein [Eubacteriales bacterium]
MIQGYGQRTRRAAGLGLAVLCTAGVVLSGCGKKADEVDTIREAGTLRAAVVDYQNDYMKDDGGTRSGTEAELIGQIAGALGVEETWVVSENMEDALSKVLAGEADLAVAMIPDDLKLEEGLEASISYGRERLYVVTRREDYSDAPAAFAGRVLAADPSLQSVLEELSGKVENLGILSCKGQEEALGALTEELTADGYVCRYQEGIRMLEASGTGNIRIQMQNLQNTDPEQFVVVARTGSGRLMGGINTIISQTEQ